MKYKINEIFYSIQGEGYYSGEPAVFIRFAQCNLSCPFCDTDHEIVEHLTVDEIYNRYKELTKDADDFPMVVFTGGEPTLQDLDHLVDIFEDDCIYTCLETNGTHIPANVDWVTLSPKKESNYQLQFCNEIKLIVNDEITDDQILDIYKKSNCNYYYLQPESNQEKHVLRCVEFVKKYPYFSLSIQTQKIIGVK